MFVGLRRNSFKSDVRSVLMLNPAPSFQSPSLHILLVCQQQRCSPRSVVSGDIRFMRLCRYSSGFAGEVVWNKECGRRKCELLRALYLRYEASHWLYISKFTRLRAVSRRQHGCCVFERWHKGTEHEHYCECGISCEYRSLQWAEDGSMITVRVHLSAQQLQKPLQDWWRMKLTSPASVSRPVITVGDDDDDDKAPASVKERSQVK